jgi:hypothetical protein
MQTLLSCIPALDRFATGLAPITGTFVRKTLLSADVLTAGLFSH